MIQAAEGRIQSACEAAKRHLDEEMNRVFAFHSAISEQSLAGHNVDGTVPEELEARVSDARERVRRAKRVAFESEVRTLKPILGAEQKEHGENLEGALAYVEAQLALAALARSCGAESPAFDVRQDDATNLRDLLDRLRPVEVSRVNGSVQVPRLTPTAILDRVLGRAGAAN
jgi:hypothetical protein